MNIIKNLAVAALLTTSISCAMAAGTDFFDGKDNKTVLKFSWSDIETSTTGKAKLLKEKLAEVGLDTAMQLDPTKEVEVPGVTLKALKNKTDFNSTLSVSGVDLVKVIGSHFETPEQAAARQAATLKAIVAPLHERDAFGRRVVDSGSGSHVPVAGKFTVPGSGHAFDEADFDAVKDSTALKALQAKIDAANAAAAGRDKAAQLKAARDNAIAIALQHEADLKAANAKLAAGSLPATFVSELVALTNGDVDSGDITATATPIEQAKEVVTALVDIVKLSRDAAAKASAATGTFTQTDLDKAIATAKASATVSGFTQAELDKAIHDAKREGATAAHAAMSSSTSGMPALTTTDLDGLFGTRLPTPPSSRHGSPARSRTGSGAAAGTVEYYGSFAEAKAAGLTGADLKNWATIAK